MENLDLNAELGKVILLRSRSTLKITAKSDRSQMYPPLSTFAAPTLGARVEPMSNLIRNDKSR